MDFEVNNETYFIDLGPEEGQWLVFAETPTGVRRVPVYVDAPFAGDDLPLLIEDKKRGQIVN